MKIFNIVYETLEDGVKSHSTVFMESGIVSIAENNVFEKKEQRTFLLILHVYLHYFFYSMLFGLLGNYKDCMLLFAISLFKINELK